MTVYQDATPTLLTRCPTRLAFNSVAGEKNHLLNVQSIAVENPALEQIGMADTTQSYALAYGVVYAAVFVAQSLPQENPVMSGFQDGGRAAIDELGAS